MLTLTCIFLSNIMYMHAYVYYDSYEPCVVAFVHLFRSQSPSRVLVCLMRVGMCWWSLLRTLQSLSRCVCVCVRVCVCVCVVCACGVCVCVCMCVRACVYGVCVCALSHTYVCVCLCACVQVCVCIYMCVHTCIHVCLCVCVWVGVSAYMHVCVCGESREPLFLPYSFSCVGGSEGIWLITQHYCTFFAQVYTVSHCERSDQGRSTTTGSASSLPRCGWHNKGVYICMCMLFVCMCRGGGGHMHLMWHGTHGT